MHRVTNHWDAQTELFEWTSLQPFHGGDVVTSRPWNDDMTPLDQMLALLLLYTGTSSHNASSTLKYFKAASGPGTRIQIKTMLRTHPKAQTITTKWQFDITYGEKTNWVLYIGFSPCPVTDTTVTIIFLVGDLYTNFHLPLLLGGWTTQTICSSSATSCFPE